MGFLETNDMTIRALLKSSISIWINPIRFPQYDTLGLKQFTTVRSFVLLFIY